MANRDIRQKLFDRLSAELVLLRPEAAGRFCCPMCLCLFDRSECDQLLTLEHIIPNGLGRKLLSLTCKQCNNDVGGAKLDSHLHKKLAIESFLKGLGEPVAVEMTVGGHRIAANWERVDSHDGIKNNFQVVGKATSPLAEQGSREAMLKMSDGDELSVSFRIASERHASVSLLKSAYLLGFRELGYRFILHDNLKPVRQQIQTPTKELLPIDALVVELTDPLAVNCAIEISGPKDIAGILVALELRAPDNSKLHRGVLLPTPASPTNFFDLARLQKQGGGKIRIKGRQIRSKRS